MLPTTKLILASIILLYLSVSVSKQYIANRYYPTEISSLWENVKGNKPDDELMFLLHKAIKLTPSNAEYYYKLARLYMKEARNPSSWQDIEQRNGLLGRAVKNAQMAINLSPANSRHYVTLAWAYSLQKPTSFHHGSASSFKKAMSLNPTTASVNYPAGYYYLHKWKHLPPLQQAQTLDILKRVIELDEKYFDRVFNDCWRIIGAYNLVQKIIPKSLKRHRGFARFLIEHKMLKEYAVEMAKVELLLVESARRMLEQKGKAEDVLKTLKQLKQAEGYHMYVRKKFPAYLGDGFKADINSIYARVYLSLAQSSLKKGDYLKATECFSKALKKVPSQYSELIKEIKECVLGIKTAQDSVNLQVLKANIEYKMGNYQAAISLLEGLKTDSLDIYQQARVFSLLERCYKALGETRAAENMASHITSLATRIITQNSWTGRAENYAAKYVYQNGEMYWAGTISTPLVLNKGVAKFIIKARASPANEIWPVMVVRLGDEIVNIVYVNNREWQNFSFQIPVSYAHQGELKITFVNDGGNREKNEDRNLYIGNVIVRSAEQDRA